ncbi:MAG: CapA family protein [Crocinitomicaceae bacterium]
MRKGAIFCFIFLLFTCQQEQSVNGIISTDENEVRSPIANPGSKLSILFAGDLLLDRGVRDQIEKKGIDFLFSGLDTLISSHNYFVVNLETPLTKIESPLNKKYLFRSEPEHALDLRRKGVTHAILSNNHSMDQNKDGLADTDLQLRNADITSIGYGENLDNFCSPKLIETEFVTVALYGSVQIPIENWFQVDDQPGVCQLQGEELENQIKTYHQANPHHLIIVNLHWGMEYLSTPNFSQIDHAKNLIDAGAELIIGHHPHVIQSVQEYKGKWIYYSIGNFIFDSTHPNAKNALLISVEIDANGHLEPSAIPIHIENCRPEIPH